MQILETKGDHQSYASTNKKKSEMRKDPNPQSCDIRQPLSTVKSSYISVTTVPHPRRHEAMNIDLNLHR